MNNNDTYYQLSLNILSALGGDMTVTYPDADAIWTAIYAIYAIDDYTGGTGLGIEELKATVTENGNYKWYSNETADAFVPVNITVDVEQKYTDEQVIELQSVARQEGYTEGETAGYNNGYSTGLSEGETAGYNNGYTVGVEAGSEAQKALLEELTVTENGVYEKEDGYNKVTVEVAGGVSGVDFGQIGWNSTDASWYNDIIQSDLDYSESVAYKMEGKTSLVNCFYNDTTLICVPYRDTSNVTNWTKCFCGCKSLRYVPKLDYSSATTVNSMFKSCSMLQYINKLDVSNAMDLYAIFSGCFNLKAIELDCSKATTLYDAFSGCNALETVKLTNTSKVSILSRAFHSCLKLKEIELDCSSVTAGNYAFYGCSALETINLTNTSRISNGSYMFYNCSSLTVFPQIDFQGLGDARDMLSNCTNLKQIPLLNFKKINSIGWMLYGCSNITDLGGFKDLGMQSTLSGTDNYFLERCPNLTHDSIMNVINNLYDRATAGYSNLTLKLHANTLALLSDEEKAIATNKGWTLA